MGWDPNWFQQSDPYYLITQCRCDLYCTCCRLHEIPTPHDSSVTHLMVMCCLIISFTSLVYIHTIQPPLCLGVPRGFVKWTFLSSRRHWKRWLSWGLQSFEASKQWRPLEAPWLIREYWSIQRGEINRLFAPRRDIWRWVQWLLWWRRLLGDWGDIEPRVTKSLRFVSHAPVNSIKHVAWWIRKI